MAVRIEIEDGPAVVTYTDSYSAGGLFVGTLIDEAPEGEEEDWELDEDWCDLTTCLPQSGLLDPGNAFVVEGDRNVAEIMGKLEALGLARPTITSVPCGFNTYRAWHFEAEALS